MHRIRLLLHFNITPILVFDGAELPMKRHTHQIRHQRREEARIQAEQAYAAGDRKRAMEMYQRACPVTADMAREVIRECRKLNVEYVVAPYEADAQLAWMIDNRVIDSVITEDSDLLAYGASKILYKFTKDGHGDFFDARNLLALSSLSMHNFTQDMFVYMCVCTGCDFFKGVPGLGIRKSHAIVKRFRSMPTLLRAIKMDRKYKVERSFATDFAKACLVFKHQTVYDMNKKCHVHLKQLDDIARASIPPNALKGDDGQIEDLSFLGAHHDDTMAVKIATMTVHPYSLKEFDQPLDLVPRPVVTRPVTTSRVAPTRNSFASFPASQSKSKTMVSELKRTVSDIRSFQVQPTSGGRAFSIPSTPNLKQRLASGSKTFNPRMAAFEFRRKQSLGNTPATGQAPGALALNQFRSRRSLGGSANSQGDPGEQQDTKDGEKLGNVKGETCLRTISSEPVDKQEHDRNRIIQDLEDEEEVVLSESNALQAKKRPREELETIQALDKNPEHEDIIFDTEYPEQQQEPNAYRVKAVKKVMDRFAQKSRSKRHKFVGTQDTTIIEPTQTTHPSQPTPDADTFSLFEEAEQHLEKSLKKQLSSPITPATKAKVTPSRKLRQTGLTATKSKKNATKASDRAGQQLISRFFATNNNTSTKQSPITPSSGRKKSRSATLTPSPKPASVLKDGASGKRIKAVNSRK